MGARPLLHPGAGQFRLGGVCCAAACAEVIVPELRLQHVQLGVDLGLPVDRGAEALELRLEPVELGADLVGALELRLKPVELGADRVGAGAPVYLTAVMEYLAAEVLQLTGNTARDNKKTRIIPRHFQLAIRNDEDYED